MIAASYISYYCGVSLCLPVDDCGFIHFILLWGLTLITSRRLWLHTFHTIVGSHSVYQQTIVALYISYHCEVSLCLPVDDCGFIHFMLLWGLTLFTGGRLWLHSFHTIVGSHSLPVDDCGFIHFILLWGLTLFTSRRLWLHSFHTSVGSHSVYRQTIVASNISYYCGVSLCLPVDDCGFIYFILLWGLTLFTSRRFWLYTFHTIVGSHSVYQQTIVASYISYYCEVTLFTSRRLWFHTFHTIVGSHSVYQQTIVASYISYYCGVSLCLPGR